MKYSHRIPPSLQYFIIHNTCDSWLLSQSSTANHLLFISIKLYAGVLGFLFSFWAFCCMGVLQICIFSGAPYGACTVCRVSRHESVKLLQLSGFLHMPEKKALLFISQEQKYSTHSASRRDLWYCGDHLQMTVIECTS